MQGITNMMQTIDTKNELNIARCTLICMIFTNPFELMSLAYFPNFLKMNLLLF